MSLQPEEFDHVYFCARITFELRAFFRAEDLLTRPIHTYINNKFNTTNFPFVSNISPTEIFNTMENDDLFYSN